MPINKYRPQARKSSGSQDDKNPDKALLPNKNHEESSGCTIWVFRAVFGIPAIIAVFACGYFLSHQLFTFALLYLFLACILTYVDAMIENIFKTP